MKYLVLVERATSPRECAFSAYVPDLPGCITTGESIEELEQNLRDAVGGWIAVAREQGDNSHPLPTGFVLQLEVPA